MQGGGRPDREPPVALALDEAGAAFFPHLGIGFDAHQIARLDGLLPRAHASHPSIAMP
jgi:hypothetical protein